jgi:hypothetical protein
MLTKTRSSYRGTTESLLLHGLYRLAWSSLLCWSRVHWPSCNGASLNVNGRVLHLYWTRVEAVVEAIVRSTLKNQPLSTLCKSLSEIVISTGLMICLRICRAAAYLGVHAGSVMEAQSFRSTLIACISKHGCQHTRSHLDTRMAQSITGTLPLTSVHLLVTFWAQSQG